MKPNPRRLALDTLIRLDAGRATLDRLIDEVDTQAPSLSRPDRALFNALIHGVLRWRGRLDWIVRYFSSTPFEKIDPPVRHVLRLGLFQILYLDRIPVSAAVNTSVELSKSVAAAWTTRFVNGVLRTAAREYHTVPYPNPAKDPVGALTASKSIPEWLARRWLDRFGYPEAGALCDTINEVSSIFLRTNTLHLARDELIASLSPHCTRAEPCRYAPEGIRLGSLKKSIHHLPEFSSGGFQVQDEGAQLIGHFLRPEPGERVLDACAGFGGKTGHMVQLMKNRGRILAMDIRQSKLIRLESEMKRLGADIVEVQLQNLLQASHVDPGRMDRILLDAPCSGLGVLRRNPDGKWRTTNTRLTEYQSTQIQMLENLSRLVKPTGILVYAVCSMEPEETDDVIDAFLKRHTQYAIDTEFTGMPDAARCVVDRGGCLRTFPHRHGTDGFFAVRLRRVG